MRCDAQYGQSLKSEVDYLGGVAAVRGEFAGVRRLQSGPDALGVTVHHVMLNDVDWCNGRVMACD